MPLTDLIRSHKHLRTYEAVPGVTSICLPFRTATESLTLKNELIRLGMSVTIIPAPSSEFKGAVYTRIESAQLVSA